MKYTKKELKEMLFTEEEIKRVIDEEYGIVERINKRYSSINEFNKQQKNANAEIIKDGERYKLVSVSDGDVKKIFDTKEDVEKFLEKEKAITIMMTNSIRRMMTDDYYIARKSLLNYNLQKASDEIVKEFTRLVEINNRVNQEEEAIWVGNYIYLNM